MGETLREIGLEVDAKAIKWLALAVNRSKLQVSLMGSCWIEERAKGLAARMLRATEGSEIEEKGPRVINSGRDKEVGILSRGFQWGTVHTVGALQYSIPVPVGWSIPAGMGRAIREKVLSLQERRGFLHRDAGCWHPLGAVALLLCMAHTVNSERLERELRKLQSGSL